MRDLSVLSDVEFEVLVADLFAAELGVSVERFARGADGGIDLRWKAAGGATWIGQCKHYTKSSFSHLRAAARGELKHLAALAPDGYRFVASVELSPQQKDQLAADLAPWVRDPADVYGMGDLDGLLTRFPAVEQAHPKLWLATGARLFWATHADLAARSGALRTRIASAIPRYVTNESFHRGAAMLQSQRVCVIAGLPGIGKTTLALALAADAMADGYAPVEVSADINDGWAVLGSDIPQIFLYDDFLGQLSFSERLGKNEDGRLVDFISEVSASRSKLLVMTTREYILNDAKRVYSRLKAIDDAKHLVLKLNDYKRVDRARILYNHLWHAAIPGPALREIASGGYRDIVDHENYNPRLIEFCTGPAFDYSTPGYADRFVDHLEHPDEVWRVAFEEHLTDDRRLLAVALASLPATVDHDDLRDAHRELCRSEGVGWSAAGFRTALQVMEGTFLAVDKAHGISRIRFHNPSVRAFVLHWLSQDSDLVSSLLRSSVFFEQVSSLHVFATGRRVRGYQIEPFVAGLAAAIDADASTFTAALVRLIESPTPERGGKYVADAVTKPLASWFEDRLSFVLDLSGSRRPDDGWLGSMLVRAAERWASGEGSKVRATALLKDLERDDHGLPEPLIVRAGVALDGWLTRDLNETDEDWIPYLERLEQVHGRLLADETGLVGDFERHALSEIERWTPGPPNMPELIEYAKRFELPDLVNVLEEHAEEADRREQMRDDEDERRERDRTARPSPADHVELAGLFARLSPDTARGDADGSEEGSTPLALPPRPTTGRP